MNPQLRATLSKAARVLAALVIFYLFLMVLMVSIAQQSVTLRLSNAEVDNGYSSTFSTYTDLKARQRELPTLRRREEALLEEVAKRESELSEREEDYQAAWSEVLPLVRRAAQSPFCGIGFDPERLDQDTVRISLWREVEQCAMDDTLSLQVRERVKALKEQGGLISPYRGKLAAQLAVKQAQTRAAALRKRISDASTLTPEEASAVSSFYEVDALRKSWMLGASLLVGFPPALVQLLLSSISGAFGALLVTLILIVYPKNALNLAGQQAYGPRMFLGALIAVCVYVILLAGTAVLGTSSGFDAAGSNYMTFCAVSILAGMFSDRVASWLSKRADIFFKTDEEEDNKLGGGGAAGTPPPPPPPPPPVPT